MNIDQSIKSDVNKQLWIQAIHYAPRTYPNTSSYKAFQVDLFALINDCKLVANCYNNSQKEYRYYSHEDLIVLFPGYEGFIRTYLSLLLGEGYEVEDAKGKQQDEFDTFLSTQTRKGTLNQEELESWVREHVERRNAVLYVDKADGFEHLILDRIQPVAISLDNSVSWGEDVAGILYNTKDTSKSIISKDIQMKYILDGKVQKVVEYPHIWYIPIDNLVILGNYLDIGRHLSIFDSDRSRTQYIVETLRLANDELSRDKIPPIIFKLKALSPRDRALALGINPTLLDTPEGVEEFQKQITIKYGMSKESITKHLLTEPQQGKATFLDMSIYDDLIPLPTNGSYQDDLDRVEDMARNVMSNLLGIPTALLGGKSDNFATAIEPLLQFTQNTLIKKQQAYLDIKFAEVSEKMKFGYTFGIDSCDFIDEKGEVEIDKVIVDTARQLIEIGIPTDDVYGWVSDEVEIDVNIKPDSERFTSSNLVPFVDPNLMDNTPIQTSPFPVDNTAPVDPNAPIDNTTPVENLEIKKRGRPKKVIGTLPTIV